MAALIALLVFLGLLSGCGGPDAANIELRKQNQGLEERISLLTRQHDADIASIAAFEKRIGTVPTLPKDRLEKLFTVHSIELGRLSGGYDLDPKKPGDEALRIIVSPRDDDGQQLKAAGSFVIEAFDLALPDNQRIGRWEFDVATARKSWLGMAMAYHYSLKCPWQRVPTHEDLTVKVTFRDELTGRQFTEQAVTKVKLPPR